MGYVRPTFVAAPSTSAILWVFAMSGYPDPNDSPYSPCFFVWRTWSSQSPCVLNSPPVPLDFVWRSFDIYIYIFFFGGTICSTTPLKIYEVPWTKKMMIYRCQKDHLQKTGRTSWWLLFYTLTMWMRQVHHPNPIYPSIWIRYLLLVHLSIYCPFRIHSPEN